MTLIFYGNDNSNSGGGGTSGLPYNAIELWVYNSDWETYSYLCTFADVTDIHSIAENAWQGEYDGNAVVFSIETDAETGEQVTKIYYGENWDEVIIRFSWEYFTENYPEQI